MNNLETQIRDYLYAHSQDEEVSEISKMAEFAMEDRKRIADELDKIHHIKHPLGGCALCAFIGRLRKGETE